MYGVTFSFGTNDGIKWFSPADVWFLRRKRGKWAPRNTHSFPFISLLRNILFMLPELSRLESTQLKIPLRGKDTPAFLKLCMALVKQKHKHILVRNRLVSLYRLANKGMIWNAMKEITIPFIKCVFTPFVYYIQAFGDVLPSSKRDISCCCHTLKSFILLCAASGSGLWAHLEQYSALPETPSYLLFPALMNKVRAAHFHKADAPLMFVLTFISCQVSYQQCGLAHQGKAFVC